MPFCLLRRVTLSLALNLTMIALLGTVARANQCYRDHQFVAEPDVERVEMLRVVFSHRLECH